MDENLVRDYLHRSRFGPLQAEALARIFAQQDAEWSERFMTKEDSLRLEAKLSRMEARMTWRIIGFVGLFGAVITLADRLL